jgi:EmrB/QacA subfamily drug resistance transporter
VAAAGRAADILGRRRVYLFGLGLFALSSLFCGAAPNEWWLIVGRGLQGVGGAAIGPAGIALVTTRVSTTEQGRALGSVAAMASVGLAVGPLLGGIITEYLGWRWIFFINLPVAVLIAALVLRAAVESRDENAHGIDYRGLALLTSGLTAFILGLTRGPEVGFLSPLTIALVGGGLLLLAAFVLQEARVRDPLIRLAILRDRHMKAASIVGFFSQFAAFAFIVLGVSFVQKAFGLSAFVAGLVLLPRVLPRLLLSRRAGRLADTVGPTLPIGVGMALIAATMAAVSVAASQSYLVMVFAFFAIGIGFALVDTPRRVAAQSSVAREYQGVVAGINSTMTRLGGTLGITILGSVLVATQYGRSVDLLSQTGVRVDQGDRFALDSLLVKGKIGSAELRQLPPHAAGSIRHAASDAYAYAFANSMRLAAIAVAVAGVVAVALLRSRADPVPGPAVDARGR